MTTENLDKVIYQLTIEDLQRVALDTLGRELTTTEINLIEEKFAENINWYGAIQSAINENIKE